MVLSMAPAPLPWSIPAQPTKMFVPSEAHIEVPHTASVKVSVSLILLGKGACRAGINIMDRRSSGGQE